MATFGGKFSRKHELAIAVLLYAPSLEDAAAQLGISERTLRRWLQQPDFEKAYRAARQAAVAHAVARVQQITGKAVTTLEQILDNEGAPAGARVGAARTILELTTKSFALEDLRAQVAELEARLQGQDQGHARFRAAG